MPNPPKSFIFCVHAHQPVGNFDHVFEEAYEKCYRPFFEVWEKHPSLPLVCHFSGSLMDWLEKHKPEFVKKIQKMAKESPVEFLGGGYYEPIFGLIPRRDLKGQLRLMAEKIESVFGRFPEGAWLTERVWDPELVSTLKKSRVQYTILDDLHLEKAGKEDPITGYFQTKDGRESLDLFASMKQLRYLMPFRKPEEVIGFIHDTAASAGDVFVFADDIEKFGFWPGTHDWVYKENWLDHFMTLLENDGSINLYTFTEFRKRFKPKGWVRVPHGSYSEMMEWSGGRFYNFLERYPESRYMHDRMRSISHRLEGLHPTNGTRQAYEQAQRALYRAQCNCPYWHGVFGGLYLHHLRSAVFENLIQAENVLEGVQRKACLLRKTTLRIQRLGSGERWQLRQKNLETFFNPRYGGAIEEMDDLPRGVNLMCNLQSHHEVYHETVLKMPEPVAGGREPLSIHQILGSKEKDLEKHLHYDVCRRLSLLDHFFLEELSLREFTDSKYSEAGDFIGARYGSRQRTRHGVREIIFEKRGHLVTPLSKYALGLKKVVTPKGDSGLCVRYSIQNNSREAVRFVWGVEFNFSIGEDYARHGVAADRVKEWILNDAWRGIKIRFVSREEVQFLAAPVETISESESGLERTYQGLGVLLQRHFFLKPKETKEHLLELSVG